MAKPKQVRWVCPQCGGGCNAPRKMRKDDARRYCLDCTGKTGRLVNRACPKLDRKRDELAGRRKRKAAQVQSQVRAGDSFGGIHVPSEYRRLWSRAVGFVNGEGRNDLGFHGVLRPIPPQLTVQTSRNLDYGASGRAYRAAYRITIRFGKQTPSGRVRGVLAHEIAHFLAWNTAHGPEFWAVLGDFVKHAYGVSAHIDMTGSHYNKQRCIDNALESCAHCGSFTHRTSGGCVGSAGVSTDTALAGR